jgi:hypothetical protein
MAESPTLLSVSGPVGLPPLPLTEKQLKGRYISFYVQIIATAETWLDKFLNFLSGLQTLEQRAKKCTELRWDYVE